MRTKIKRRVLVKLGNNCNQSCAYCHASKNKEYIFNEDIITFLQQENIDKIGFGGGEPLMYFERIKQIITTIDNRAIDYKFTSNGFLLTEDIVRFLNEHAVAVHLSFDGLNTGRQYPGNDALTLYSKLEHKAISTVVFNDNINLDKLSTEAHEFALRSGMPIFHMLPSFIHQTTVNEENLSRADRNTAKAYIKYYNALMEGYIYMFLAGQYTFIRGIMLKIGERYNDNLYTKGCMCCNENNMMLTASGDFLLCPYGNNIVGDIYKGIDWDYVERFVPKRCQACELRNKCGCSCVTNVTDNECYIYKNTYDHFLKICDKYHVTPQELKARIKEVYLE